jgi:hypothetical protein
MSSSCEVTTTFSAVAVPGLAAGKGAGVEPDLVAVGETAGVETASCAATILVIKRTAPNTIGNLFMEICYR